MTTQYTSILKLALPVQGELSGTWGDTVNDNITSMVEEAIAGRSVINSWTANSHTLTTADGTTSESRAAMLEFTDTGAALSGNATVICPTASKIYIAKNAVGSSRTVTLKTSAGTGIAIPDGTTMFLFCDGTNVVEAVTNINSFNVGGTVAIDAIKDEDNMASDSATALATQQSIKAYVDSQVGSFDTLAEVLAQGNTTGGTDIAVGTGDDITFADSSKAIFGAGSDLQIYHDGSNSYIDDQGTGGLYIRSSSNMFLTAANGEKYFRGTVNGAATLYYDDAEKLATTSTGIDVTGVITTDGMTTSGNVDFGDSDIARFGDGNDLQIYHDGANSYIEEAGTGNLFIRGTSLILEDAGGNDYIAMTDTGTGGTVEIKHNAATKLTTTSTGIDVTGTVTADGLTVESAGTIQLTQNTTAEGDLLGRIEFHDEDAVTGDGGVVRLEAIRGGDVDAPDFQIISTTNGGVLTNRLFLDSATGNIGIGTTSPNYQLTVGDGTDALETINIISTDASQSRIFFSDASNNGQGRFTYDHSNDSLQIFTNDTERMRIDSNGNVGIGTSSPSAALQIGSIASGSMSTSSRSLLIVGDSGADDGIRLTRDEGSQNQLDQYTHINNDGTATFTSRGGTSTTGSFNFKITDGTTTTTPLHIDSSGNVGIGTDSPASLVELEATSETVFDATDTAGQDSAGTTLAIQNLSDTDDTFSQILFRNRNTSKAVSRIASLTNATGTQMAFVVENAGTPAEAMRIDSSGNITQTNTGAGAGAGPLLDLHRDSASPADNDYIGEIRFRGENDASEVTSYAGLAARIIDVTDGTEDGRFELYTSLNGAQISRVLSDSSTTIINQDAADLDFRVESDTNANAIFMNAGQGITYFGHGNTMTGNTFNFQANVLNGFSIGSSNAVYSVLSQGGQDGDLYLVSNAYPANLGSSRNVIIQGGTSGGSSPKETARFNPEDGVIFNEQSIAAHDFRIESDSLANIFNVDAARDEISMGHAVNTAYDALISMTVNDSSSMTDFQTTLLLNDNTSTNAASGGSILFSGNDGVSSRGFAKIVGGKANSTSGDYGGQLLFRTRVNGDATIAENMRINGSGIVVNETSADQDFRVESADSTHMLFLDAFNNRIGINDSSPDYTMHVNSGGANVVAKFESTDSTSVIQFVDNNGNSEFGTSGSTARISPAGSYAVLEASQTDVVLNNAAQNTDFRVESATNTHMLFVDASADTVGIGTSLANTPLTVSGSNGAMHSFLGYFSRETSDNTVDILSVSNQNANSGTAIYGRLVATCATSDAAAVIEFWAALQRSGGGANSATALTPVISKTIVGSGINAGTLAWSGTTLQYTTSGFNYIGYSMELQVTNRDGATITILP